MTTIQEQRLLLGEDAVLSVSRAIELLPWRDADAKEWLEREGLIRRERGLPGPVVIWGDVLRAIRNAQVPQGDQRPAPKRQLERSGCLK